MSEAPVIKQHRTPGFPTSPNDDGYAARSAWRLKRLGWMGASNVFVQGAKILLYLISVPLTLRYLSPERFGLWLTLSSLMAWLSVTDLGMRDSLVNILSAAHGREDEQVAASAVTTALTIQWAMAMLLILISAPLIFWVDWRSVFNVTSAVSLLELHLSLGALVISLAALLIANGIIAVYFGYQEGYWANLWQLGGMAMAGIGLLFATHYKSPIWILILLTTALPMVSTAAGGVVLFWFERPGLRPHPSKFDWQMAKRLLSLGGMYIVAQLTGAGMFNSQNFIVSHFLGADRVGTFGVTQKVVTLPATLMILFTTPLIASVGEAHARGDSRWISDIQQRIVKNLWIWALPAMVILLLLLKPMLTRLSSHVLTVNWELTGLLAIYCVVIMFAQPFSVVLYGLAKVRLQAFITTATAALTIGLAVLFVTRMGLPGMGLAMLIPAALNMMVVAYFAHKEHRGWNSVVQES